jgi:hypothetical protein
VLLAAQKEKEGGNAAGGTLLSDFLVCTSPLYCLGKVSPPAISRKVRVISPFPRCKQHELLLAFLFFSARRRSKQSKT